MSDSEPINPGFPTPFANPEVAALERRLESMERALMGYTARQIGSIEEDGEVAVYEVLAKRGGDRDVEINGSASCGFGTIYLEDSEWFLTGGVISAGPDHHEVPDFRLDTDGDYFVWAAVIITANTADDVLLPGIQESASAFLQTGDSYPSGEIPTYNSPTKSAIVPLGFISVSEGTPTFRKDGPCSPVTMNHCPGSVTYV